MSLSLSVGRHSVVQLGIPALGVTLESINSELFIWERAAKCFPAVVSWKTFLFFSNVAPGREHKWPIPSSEWKGFSFPFPDIKTCPLNGSLGSLLESWAVNHRCAMLAVVLLNGALHCHWAGPSLNAETREVGSFTTKYGRFESQW